MLKSSFCRFVYLHFTNTTRLKKFLKNQIIFVLEVSLYVIYLLDNNLIDKVYYDHHSVDMVLFCDLFVFFFIF